MPLVTKNFAQVLRDAPSTQLDQIDTRHFIYARDNTLDLAQYLNYLKLIKPIAMQSKKTGLLELGFIPLIMVPSFFEDKMHSLILPKIGSLPYHTRPAMSFLNTPYTSDYPDIWVSKMDGAELLGVKPHEVTVNKVLEVLLCN